MNVRRVVPFCLLAVLIPPLACSAQSRSPFAEGAVAPSNSSSAVTSVHELQIPEKARKACREGTKRFAAKDAAGSVVEFQKAIKAFPGYYEAYAKMGASELELEQWGPAESAFRKSMELSQGRYAPANFGLGLILATVTKKFDEAEAVVRSGLETAPTNVSGNFVLAWVLYSTARLKEAEESVRQAIAFDPRAAGAHLLLAQIHLQEHKMSDVVTDLDSYLNLGLTSPLDDSVRTVRAQALRALAASKAGAEIADAGR
jgi:Tfp pilus assembly protein PilF